MLAEHLLVTPGTATRRPRWPTGWTPGLTRRSRSCPSPSRPTPTRCGRPRPAARARRRLGPADPRRPPPGQTPCTQPGLKIVDSRRASQPNRRRAAPSPTPLARSWPWHAALLRLRPARGGAPVLPRTTPRARVEQRAYRAGEWAHPQPQPLPRPRTPAASPLPSNESQSSTPTSPTASSTRPSTRPANRPTWVGILPRPWRGSEQHARSPRKTEPMPVARPACFLSRSEEPGQVGSTARARQPARSRRPHSGHDGGHRPSSPLRLPRRRPGGAVPPVGVRRSSPPTSTRASGSACSCMPDVPDYRLAASYGPTGARSTIRTASSRLLGARSNLHLINEGRHVSGSGMSRRLVHYHRGAGARDGNSCFLAVRAQRLRDPAQGRLQQLGRPCEHPMRQARHVRRGELFCARCRQRHGGTSTSSLWSRRPLARGEGSTR